MKTLLQPVSILFLAMITAGFLSIPDAGADQGSCVLQATNTDAFVIVYDIFVKVQPL